MEELTRLARPSEPWPTTVFATVTIALSTTPSVSAVQAEVCS